MIPSSPLRLLDTDVLIDVQRGHPPVVAWFNALTQRPGVPGLVLMEMIQDAQNAGQVRLAESLVYGLPLFWSSTMDCQRALADYRKLHLSHNPGLTDPLIGATTIGLSATLCTNVKHRRRVVGLVIEQPYLH